MKLEIKKSVRELVELVLKSGSLDNTFKTNARAIEGVRAHQKLQKSNAEIFKNYEKEVYLDTKIDVGKFLLHIDGRCDGIIEDLGRIIVEEIKSTYVPLNLIYDDFNEMHWSQGKIYAYMVCEKRNIDVVYVQLSYYNLENNEVKSFLKKYTRKELIDYIMELVSYYKKYIEIQMENKIKRDNSIKELQFPFTSYRKGQLSFIKSCYGTIRDKEKIFIEAPTGTGKTISTIFPALKSLSSQLSNKIFYLTAKGANKATVEDTLSLLRDRGLKIKTITIQAKEKMCLNDKVSCNKEDCIYANLYYDKLKKNIMEIVLDENEFSIENIIKYAKKYEICPFELSLDLIEWCDFVICDYNYIFDPKVQLNRVIEDAENTTLLIDEAHNLVDRSRASYSARLCKSEFNNIKKEIRGVYPALYKKIDKVIKLFIQERMYCEEEGKGYIYYKDLPKDLCKELRILCKEIDRILSIKKNNVYTEKLIDLFFEINAFFGVSELYNDQYYTYIENISDDIRISLFCANPSKNLKSVMDKFRAIILFSATLSPFYYFIKILGGNENSYRLRLKSPFPKENFKVCIYRANTRYKVRDKTIPEISNKIAQFILDNMGNYMVFFPSYEYMNNIYNYLEKHNILGNIICQQSNMTDEEQSGFINMFKQRNNITGFCVMGGSFSEGIDLPGDKLVGVIIVGVGYPKVSIEGEIIYKHFGEEGESIAYIYPGINKVLQAAGRVIRTETDKGRLLLIDDRYLKRDYYNLLPENWKPISLIK